MSRPNARPVGPDALGRQQDVDPAARAQVEHALSLVEVGDGGRVAAAEAGQDGGVGQLGALERGVELADRSSRRIGAAAALLALTRGGGVVGADVSWMVSVVVRVSTVAVFMPY